MVESTLDEIMGYAYDFVAQKESWHFHILTPECMLNNTGRYALIIENTISGKSSVCYSDEPYMDVGKELVKLLHGDDVVSEETKDSNTTESSQAVQDIITRVRSLNEQGVSWHHHMLFPGCRFNNHSDMWVIVFEDKETGEIVESVTSREPKSDLVQIESLFYVQKKAE